MGARRGRPDEALHRECPQAKEKRSEIRVLDHDPSSILDRRLATEGQRRGLSPEACRELAVVAGLDAFQE